MPVTFSNRKGDSLWNSSYRFAFSDCRRWYFAFDIPNSFWNVPPQTMNIRHLLSNKNTGIKFLHNTTLSPLREYVFRSINDFRNSLPYLQLELWMTYAYVLWMSCWNRWETQCVNSVQWQTRPTFFLEHNGSGLEWRTLWMDLGIVPVPLHCFSMHKECIWGSTDGSASVSLIVGRGSYSSIGSKIDSAGRKLPNSGFRLTGGKDFKAALSCMSMGVVLSLSRPPELKSHIFMSTYNNLRFLTKMNIVLEWDFFFYGHRSTHSTYCVLKTSLICRQPTVIQVSLS